MFSFNWKNGLFTAGLLCVFVCSPLKGYADTSWVDILKPLVKDVIVPGANAGMKKLMEKKLGAKAGSKSTSSTEAAVTSTDSMPEEPMTSTDSKPEEPVSSTGSDTLLSMPDEPNYQASSDTGAPPPPVETP